MDQDQITQAGKIAEDLADQVRHSSGDLSSVYSALEEAALAYQRSGGSLQRVVPGSDEAALGFKRGRPDGKSIWKVYAEVLHDDLCDSKRELHQQVKMGLATSGATLITLIMGLLGLPATAAVIVAPIAGSILGLGIEAFCKYSVET